MKRALLRSSAFAALLVTTTLLGNTPEHERLRVRNTFKSPDEVVAYYCGRDASGFVWSGLLEAERKAFTLWPHAPEQDSFYVAKAYKVGPARYLAGDASKSRATVNVNYEMTVVSDAFGTKIPVAPREKNVLFELVRVDGHWKISKPSVQDIAPVVLESKFPL